MKIPGPTSSLVCFPMKVLQAHSLWKGEADSADADGRVFVCGHGMGVGTFVRSTLSSPYLSPARTLSCLAALWPLYVGNTSAACCSWLP